MSLRQRTNATSARSKEADHDTSEQIDAHNAAIRARNAHYRKRAQTPLKQRLKDDAARNLAILAGLAVVCLFIGIRAGEVHLPAWLGSHGAAKVVKLQPGDASHPRKGAKTSLFNLQPVEATPAFSEDTERLSAVTNAFKHSYSAYERDAWACDNYHPLPSKSNVGGLGGGSNLTSSGGIGYFILDTLDFLYMLDLKPEIERAKTWLRDLHTFDVDDRFHAFEVTIRCLGGLLSAYHLSGGEAIYLEKAKELGDRLLPVFDTPSGIPASFINLKTGQAIYDFDNYNMSSLAEAGTLQLEFRYLSELTEDPIYWEKAERATSQIAKQAADMDMGLPFYLDPNTGEFRISDIRLGSRSDSYYEYLLKLYLQSDRTDERYRKYWDHSLEVIAKTLINITPRHKLLYTQELIPQRDLKSGGINLATSPKQDHLVAFLPGLIMLGVTEGQPDAIPADTGSFDEKQEVSWQIGTNLLQTFATTYFQSRTGLSPEIAFFYTKEEIEQKKDRRDWYIAKRQPARPGFTPDPPGDAKNMLRPETVESLFLAYRQTGDPKYREWGWKIFEAFERHAKIKTGGYATVRDVDELPVQHENRMETFWLSETLKYLYLLFADASVLPLNENVFNTEAHVLPVFTPKVTNFHEVDDAFVL
ncbi:glycoside hydrolase family 47 protein [Mixia osmundae IAM 14324]|uniref:alpha-1,2-Mannosidase n=1 Tax=Mixia osmundae (strain CBS 9802 / IAM 14324 / JCM 22182 / KY 12970) TaxID=764103 RepID=G7E137_MIXOS|nr:glycoside hydrolase family 47 protein [Mixia osmundae IAM 14324]KEI38817.1 glycoside hydrolase family 47 protein [Mixia osmundae IAM 14324]GAA96547.1 hypothetical protein E5Q_03215 [Mixia osmundae IAM 14324]